MANNISILDSASAAQVVKTTDNAGVHTPHHNVDTCTVVSTVTNLATVGTSITPGVAAAHLGKAEDAAHSSGDTGVFVLGVRSDTQASLAGTTGDYTAPTFDAFGGLWTHPVSTITKTQGDLFALATVAINTVSLGSAVNVPDGATTLDLLVQFAQSTTTAPAAGTKIALEGSYQSSGNDQWVEIPSGTIVTGTTAAESEAVTGTENAGATVIEMASTTNLGARTEWVFFLNGTVGNSEWAELVSIVANVSITLKDGITNAQTGSTVYDQAAVYQVQADVSGLKRIRTKVDNNFQATGPTVAVRVTYNFRVVG